MRQQYRGEIVIPTTDPKSPEIVREICTKFATRFGGYSTYDGEGGWMSDGDCITEDHIRIVTNFDPDSGGEIDSKESFANYLEVQARYVKESLGEEAVMVEIKELDVLFV